jgi:GNAT superfamily N-acetyltransferase
MSNEILIRPAELRDVPVMAAIRAREWGTDSYWIDRIGGYLKGEHFPQHALLPRAAWVAVEGVTIEGFVAGHLTRRFGCDGELEWINVVPERRGKGIADRLMAVMLDWFTQQGATQICVNVEPANEVARRLYTKHGAVPMSSHWMIWKPERFLPGLFDQDAL